MTTPHPYYIHAPNYRENSLGIRVLHNLCHLLNQNGFPAFIVGAETVSPKLNTPLLTEGIAIRHDTDGLTPISVYPETTSGNPLNTKINVRYMLNKEGVIGGNRIKPGANDVFYYFSKSFTPNDHDAFNYLHLPLDDFELCREDPEATRTGPLLYVSRVPLAKIDMTTLPADIEVLSNLAPLPLTELVKKLQRATVLYSYELSGTCRIAMLCGCPVVFRTLPGHERYAASETQLRNAYHGLGYTWEDSPQAIAAARAQLGPFREALLAGQQISTEQLRTFIVDTQTRAQTYTRNHFSEEYTLWLRERKAQPSFYGAQGAPRPQLAFAILMRGDDAALARTQASIQAAAGESPVTVLGASPAAEELNRLAAASTSEDAWIGLLQAGDELDTDFYPQLLDFLAREQDASLVYCDEDSKLPDGRLIARFKPAMDIDLLRSSPYLGSFLAVRHPQLKALGLNAAQAPYALHDYALRHIENFGPASVRHFPEVLLHADSAAHSADLEHFARITLEHLQRCGVSATVSPGLIAESLRVSYEHANQPLVSIVIPTRDQQALLSRCLEGLVESTTYQNYEILVVDNGSTEAEAQQYLQGLEALNLPKLRVLRFADAFNYSAINNFAAHHAQGEYLLLLNNDTAVLDGNWLEAMLQHAQRPEVGVVGAKLLFPDGRIQHASMILGLRGPADNPFIGHPIDANGYGGRLKLDQQCSAVSASCLMIRKSLFEALGGMDEKMLHVAYNDVDLCLKVREAGYSVVWTPYAQLMHAAHASLKAQSPERQRTYMARIAVERHEMFARWMPQIKADPFYNPNFRLRGAGFQLEPNPIFRPPLPGQKKVLAHNADIWGSGLYRMVAPATTLAEQGLSAGGCYGGYFLPAEVARIDPDIIVLQRQITDAQLKGARDYRSYSRAKLIFELDDYLPNIPHTNSAKAKMPVDLVRRMRKAMSICERIIVSTDPLRESMLEFHDEVVVLPNYLPLSLWGDLPARPERDLKRKPRVGWAGGSSHMADLRVIADVVRALADKVDWVFFGLKPEGLDHCIAEYHDGVPLGQYPAKLASLDLDLALAPLEDNFFNTCKSNLRLLELGVCGYPMIATDLEPYRCGFPVTLVSNRFRDWVGAIEAKLADREALYEEGLALQSFVRSQWMLEGDNLLRWRSGWLLDPQR